MKKVLLSLAIIATLGAKAQLIAPTEKTIIGRYAGMNPNEAGDLISYQLADGTQEYVWSYVNADTRGNNPIRKSIKFKGDSKTLETLYTLIKNSSKEFNRITLGEEVIELSAIKMLGAVEYVIKTDNSLGMLRPNQLDKLFGKK